MHTNFYVSSSASTLGEVYREQVKKIKLLDTICSLFANHSKWR